MWFKNGKYKGSIMFSTKAIPMLEEKARTIVVAVIVLNKRVPIAGCSMTNPVDTFDVTRGRKLALRRALKQMKAMYPDAYKMCIQAIWEDWYNFNEIEVPSNFFNAVF